MARRGLAILTCIDSRIDPLAVFGLEPGDAKILRNAGARVTDDALRTLALAAATLGVTRIAVVQHTDCAMASASDAELAAAVAAATGRDHPELRARWPSTDQAAVLRADVDVVLASPLLRGRRGGGRAAARPALRPSDDDRRTPHQLTRSARR